MSKNNWSANPADIGPRVPITTAQFANNLGKLSRALGTIRRVQADLNLKGSSGGVISEAELHVKTMMQELIDKIRSMENL